MFAGRFLWLRAVILVIAMAGTPSARAQTEPVAAAAELARQLRTSDDARCDDLTFLRRARVVLTGRTATPDEAWQVANQTHPLDRAQLIERLLRTPEYYQVWGRWMARLTGCDEVRLSPAGFAMKIPRERISWFWQNAMADRLRANTPWSEIVTEVLAANSRRASESYAEYERRYNRLITAGRENFDDGGYFEDGPLDLFFKTSGNAVDKSELIARNLLGYRMECARCHDHPASNWTTDDHANFAAVFQRTVYAELPVTRSQKALVVLAAAGAAILITLLCVALGAWLVQRRCRVPAVLATLGASAAIGIGSWAVISYARLLTDSTAAQHGGFAVGLNEQLGDSAARVVMAAWVCGAVLLLAGVWRSFRMRRPRAVLTATAICSAGVLAMTAAADLSYVQRQPPESPRMSLLSQLVKTGLTRAGLGGRGQQVREIYDDTNGNFPVLGQPKALGGPMLRDGAGQSPRQQFADWLRGEGSQQLARNLVNRVAQRIFSRPFVEPLDDFRPDVTPRDAELLEALTQQFIAHDQSLTWLLQTLLTSDRFQTAGATPADQIAFTPRALQGEEIVASINQLSDTTLALSPKWSPTPSDPFTSGAFNTGSKTLADRILSAAAREDERTSLSVHSVAILLTDPEFQQFLGDVADARSADAGHSDNNLAALCAALWGRRPTPQERELLRAADTPRDTLWLLLNSDEFLILD